MNWMMTFARLRPPNGAEDLRCLQARPDKRGPRTYDELVHDHRAPQPHPFVHCERTTTSNVSPVVFRGLHARALRLH